MQITHNGKTYIDLSIAELLAAGVPANTICAALKLVATGSVVKAMNGYRNRVASSCAGKLVAYQFKAEIASNPGNAQAEDLTLLDREASARGLSQGDLLNLINSKHSAYRQIALLIEALEAEGKAAIANVPEVTNTVETDLVTALQNFLTAATAELNAAFASLNGGQ